MRIFRRAPKAEPTPPGFDVQWEWKETVYYWEGERGFRFDAGWGVTPHVLYVPDEATWDQTMPDWLVGRRELVVKRLVRHSGHRVEAVAEQYSRRDSTLFR